MYSSPSSLYHLFAFDYARVYHSRKDTVPANGTHTHTHTHTHTTLLCSCASIYLPCCYRTYFELFQPKRLAKGFSLPLFLHPFLPPSLPPSRSLPCFLSIPPSLPPSLSLSMSFYVNFPCVCKSSCVWLCQQRWLFVSHWSDTFAKVIF